MHGLRPLLTVLLKGPFQFSQMMGIAQGMGTAVTIVGLPVIMTEDALIRWQDTHFIRCFIATLGMGIEVRYLFA